MENVTKSGARITALAPAMPPRTMRMRMTMMRPPLANKLFASHQAVPEKPNSIQKKNKKKAEKCSALHNEAPFKQLTFREIFTFFAQNLGGKNDATMLWMQCSEGATAIAEARKIFAFLLKIE